jgi:hypothetical protein
MEDKRFGSTLVIILGNIYSIRTKNEYKDYRVLLQYLNYTVKKPDKSFFVHIGRLLNYIGSLDTDIRSFKPVLMKYVASKDLSIVEGALQGLSGGIYAKKSIILTKEDALIILPSLYSKNIAISGRAAALLGFFIEPKAMEYDLRNAKLIYDKINSEKGQKKSVEAELLFKKCEEILKK